MKYIQIDAIGDYPEDFLIAKVDVEHRLQETGAIEKRMKLDEFILWLALHRMIYLKNGVSIAFRTADGERDRYVFYSLLDGDDKTFSAFKSRLETIEYDVSKLRKISPSELINLDLGSIDIFMVDNKMYA